LTGQGRACHFVARDEQKRRRSKNHSPEAYPANGKDGSFVLPSAATSKSLNLIAELSASWFRHSIISLSVFHSVELRHELKPSASSTADQNLITTIVWKLRCPLSIPCFPLLRMFGANQSNSIILKAVLPKFCHSATSPDYHFSY
jgi:hypothetical protein